MTESATGATGWIPAPPARFLGREDAFETLDRTLSGSGRALAIPAEGAPQGVGTSEFVFEYGRRAGRRYSSVFHVHAGSAVQFTCELARIAREVIDVEGRLEPSRAVRVLRDWLGCRSNWLLIVDGLPSGEYVEPLLPLGTGHLLMTSGRSTAAELPDVPTLELGPLRPRHVLDDLAGQEASEIESATDVARAVGHSPLGLAVAAAVVDRSGGSWGRFREALADVRIDWLENPTGTESVLALAIDGLARVRPAEMKLLCALATFTPSVVPLDVLDAAGDTLGRTLAGTGRVRQLVDELVRWNLVRWMHVPGGASAVSILPPVQSLLLRSLPEPSRRRWTSRSIEFAGQLTRTEGLDSLDVLPLVVGAARRAVGAGESPQLVADAADLHEENGFVLAAESLRTELLASTSRRLEPALRVALDRAIAESLANRGQTVEAARGFADVLGRVEQLLIEGASSDEDRRLLAVERARVRVGLGRVHRRLGRFAESSRALEPVLEETGLRPDVHGRALLQFAFLEIAALRWESADEALVRAGRACALGDDAAGVLDVETARCSLLVQRRALDAAGEKIDVLLENVDRSTTDAPGLATLWRMRGDVHRRLGGLPEAESCCRRALAIDEIARGVEGREVALDRAGLAAVLQARGDHANAVREFERAARGLDGQPDGDLDDSMAVILARLCRSLLETGETTRAADVSRTALRLRSRRPFAGDLDLAEILESRALVLVARRRHVEAAPFLERAVTIVRRCVVDPDLESRAVRFALALCLVKSGHLEEAGPVLEDCIHTDRRRLEQVGGTPAELASTRADLVRSLLLSADRLERQERFETSESVLDEVVRFIAADDGETTALHRPGVLRRLARVQRMRRRFAVARRSIELSLELLARNEKSVTSPSVVRSRLELARLHADRRDFDEARAILDDVAGSLADGDDEGRSAIEFERGSLELLAERRGVARRHFERALALREGALGEKHVTLTPCLDGLVRAWLEEQPERAVENARRAVLVHEECRVPDLVEYASSLEWLGRALNVAGARREAVEVLQRIPPLHEKSYPAEHPATVGAVGELGIVLMKLDRPDEAVPPLESAVRMLEARDGAREASGSEQALWLARAHSAIGRHEEAIARVTAATAAPRRGAEERDDRLIEILTVREEVLRRAGRSDEADAVRAELASWRDRRENVLF